MTETDYDKNRVIVIDGIEYHMTDEDIEAEKRMDEKEKFFDEHPELIPDYLHRDNDD